MPCKNSRKRSNRIHWICWIHFTVFTEIAFSATNHPDFRLLLKGTYWHATGEALRERVVSNCQRNYSMALSESYQSELESWPVRVAQRLPRRDCHHSPYPWLSVPWGLRSCGTYTVHVAAALSPRKDSDSTIFVFRGVSLYQQILENIDCLLEASKRVGWVGTSKNTPNFD